MRARVFSLLLAAGLCLLLGGCGSMSAALSGISVEPAGVSDGEAHILSLKYRGAGGADMTFEVFTLRDGEWAGPAPQFSIPEVDGGGSLNVIFNFLPERISARFTGGTTATDTAVADMGDLREPESDVQGVVYITSPADAGPGERIPVAMQYYGGEAAPSLEDFAAPGELEGYDAVYVLTVKFE